MPVSMLTTQEIEYDREDIKIMDASVHGDDLHIEMEIPSLKLWANHIYWLRTEEEFQTALKRPVKFALEVLESDEFDKISFEPDCN